MNELYNNLKHRFGQEKMVLKNSKVIEITFNNCKEIIVIQKGATDYQFTVSYPELKDDKGQKIDTFTTVNNIMEEGVFWILNQISKNGKVLPEF